MKVALVGLGYLGSAYARVYQDAVMYDEPQNFLRVPNDDPIVDFKAYKVGKAKTDDPQQCTHKFAKAEVNSCDVAIIAVPTDPLPDGSLDMSIVESVVKWVNTPLIIIKSALMPGTVERLVKKTGKRIAVSVGIS